MIKQLGAVRALPKPNSKVMDQALNLLSVMGGEKSALKLLKELRSVQEYNEKVLDEAKSAISEANRLQELVTSGRAKFDKERNAANAKLDSKSTLLIEKARELDSEWRQFKSAEDANAKMRSDFEKSLEGSQSAVQAREKAVAKSENDLQAKFAAVKKAEVSNAAYKKKLDDRNARVTAAAAL